MNINILEPARVALGIPAAQQVEKPEEQKKISGFSCCK